MLLLDAGASVEVRPEHLVQFAYMGAGFMEAVVGIERPAVGLLSVGEESGKGTPDVLTAHERIAEAGGLNFVGNVEGFDIPTAGADVVVADGFTGNVALKVLEGTLKVVGGEIRSRDPLGAGLDPRRPAGPRQARRGCARTSTPRRWAARSCSGCGSRSSWRTAASARAGIEHAVKLARRAVDEDMVGRTTAALEAAGALRSATAASVAQR